MGLPALLLPETWVTPKGKPPFDPAIVFEHMQADLRGLLHDVRRIRPAEGSPEEASALTRSSLLSLSMLRAVGPNFVVALRSSLNQALADLVRKELAAAEPERKLALRHVEHAVHRYGVLMESLAAALSPLSQVSLGPLLDDLAEQANAGAASVEGDDRVVLRFVLDVLVALDVLDAELDELTFWAFRAITSTRRVEAMPNPVTVSGLRGELARVRARRSWVAWDDDEVDKELAPWPSPSR